MSIEKAHNVATSKLWLIKEFTCFNPRIAEIIMFVAHIKASLSIVFYKKEIQCEQNKTFHKLYTNTPVRNYLVVNIKQDANRIFHDF